MDGRWQAFSYTALPGRVVFGAGRRADVIVEARQLGCARPFIITTPDQAAAGVAVASQFDREAASCFANATMHTPWEVTSQAMEAIEQARSDCLIAIGGGSSIGLSKAIALRTDLPKIVLPTTYAGSEVTPIIGETRDGEKRTQRTLKVLPEVVIYDVDFTLSLPAALSATSGLNAIAHAVEALYAVDANPITSIIAEEGIASMASALPSIIRDPRDIDARRSAQYGAWLCGTCLGTVGMALHHKICHVLGGTFNMPHAETHAVMIPHVTAYNADAAPHAIARVARALGATEAWDGLHSLAKTLGTPTSLAELGMPEEGIRRATDLITQNAYTNPRRPDATSVRAMLERAWRGLPPERIQ
jgi:alcohol dehydrogenase class IV